MLKELILNPRKKIPVNIEAKMLHVDSNSKSPPVNDATPPTATVPPTPTSLPSSSTPPILHLFYDLSSDDKSEESEDKDSKGHGYSVMAVPETVTVPYKLRSGKPVSPGLFLIPLWLKK